MPGTITSILQGLEGDTEQLDPSLLRMYTKLRTQLKEQIMMVNNQRLLSRIHTP